MKYLSENHYKGFISSEIIICFSLFIVKCQSSPIFPFCIFYIWRDVERFTIDRNFIKIMQAVYADSNADSNADTASIEFEF